jgi:hypothetical protein
VVSVCRLHKNPWSRRTYRISLKARQAPIRTLASGEVTLERSMGIISAMILSPFFLQSSPKVRDAVYVQRQSDCQHTRRKQTRKMRHTSFCSTPGLESRVMTISMTEGRISRKVRGVFWTRAFQMWTEAVRTAPTAS